jgi:hypothetical protein
VLGVIVDYVLSVSVMHHAVGVDYTSYCRLVAQGFYLTTTLGIGTGKGFPKPWGTDTGMPPKPNDKPRNSSAGVN